MLIVYVSNILNHHSKPLCESFIKCSDDFFFIETETVSNLGFQKRIPSNYVVEYSINNFEKNKQVFELLDNADAVIFGQCPSHLVEYRMKKGLLSFIYAERYFKKGMWHRFIPSTRRAIKEKIINYKADNLYILSASAYLPYELYLLGFPKEKCLKWGYFPEAINEDLDALFYERNKKNTIEITWAGRFLEWKHPSDAMIAFQLIHTDRQVHLNMIGDGVLYNKLKTEKKTNITFTGAISPSEVRHIMERSDIFIATSDYYEGWGAVINEAMNSACAAVCSHAMGASPYLIKDGTNGYLYRYGNNKMLSKKLEKLINNDTIRKEFQIQAYNAIMNYWNSAVAAERLISIVKDQRNIGSFQEGPCEVAPLLRNNWYKENP